MNKRKERALETFLIITFPVALFAGCAGNGDIKTSSSTLPSWDESAIETQTVTREEMPERNTVLTGEAPVNAEVKQDSTPSQSEQTVLRFFGTFEQSVQPDSRQSSNTIDTVKTDSQLPESIEGYNAQQARSTSKATLDDESQTISDQISMETTPSSDSARETSVHSTVVPGKHSIQFGSDQYEVSSEDVTVLKQHAEFLSSNPNLILTIAGHSDSQGSERYNQILSEKRAQRVADILMSYGAPQEQLIIDSYGETVPVKDRRDWNENRRVELQYNSAVILSSGL
jgi:outer membrane protein OmpA-like peptidoglycan-associated protein